MDRRSTGLFLAPLAIAVLIFMPGCVGNGTPNEQASGVQTVTLNPSNTISLELGTTQNFIASARNGSGGTVFGTIQYASDNNPSLTISTGGVACAGTWDSLSNPTVCNPGVSGIVHVTASLDGVSSTPTTVYVHQHVQSVSLSPAQTRQCPKPGMTNCPCFSQGETFTYQATAMSANKVDITNTVGPFDWSATPSGVLTIDVINDLPNNQAQVTARIPGVATLFASVSGTTSTPLNYTTCLVKSIKLQVQNDFSNAVTINAGGTTSVVPEVVDTLDFTLTSPPLTWSTSNPEVATVSNTGVVTGRQEAGMANISASCTPPSCNIGVLPGLPIYSSGGTRQNQQPAFGVITVSVLQSKPPTGTAWTATTDCGNAFNCTSVMFPVTPGDTPIGAGVTLPFTPNSMLFNPDGSRVYLGSDQGLMFVDVSAQTLSVSTVSAVTTPCNIAVCGKPLAISPDGTKVVVSDIQTNPNQVYIFDTTHATSPPTDLLINGAVSAAFSPDQMKLFITTNDGNLFVFSTVDALHQVTTAAPANGINFAADGSFAYVAGTPLNAISGYATCNLKNMGASSGLASNPLLVFPLPDTAEEIISKDQSVITENLIAVEPPNLQFLSAQFTHHVLDQPDQVTCDGPGAQTSPTFNLAALLPPINLGQGDFIPLFAQPTGDGSKVTVVAQNIPAVLFFDVASKTTSAFPLTGGALPRAASSTLDGTQIFVAACDAFVNNDPSRACTNGSVHIVNAQQGGDIQEVIYTNVNTNDSMCTNLPGPPCLPNLLAVRPQ